MSVQNANSVNGGWFSTTTKVTTFENRGEGRLSVDEYVAKIKQSEDNERSAREQREALRPELVSIIQKVKDTLLEKGVNVSFKDVVDNIYIPEIEKDTQLPEVSFIHYKNIIFHVSEDDEVL